MRPWPTKGTFAVKKINKSINKLINPLIFCKKRDNQQYRCNGIAQKSNMCILQVIVHALFLNGPTYNFTVENFTGR
jgi:hypothetical protein